MGKKTTPDHKQKKNKGKFKEMFPELATHQEEIVQRRQETRQQHPKRVIRQDSEQDVELDVLEHQNNDLDTICETVHRLLSKNKVSAKNAFEVPLIDLEQLPDFTGSLENQYAWKKLSSTLQNDYKIYAYRVDAIHSITYNILHTMNRRQQDIDALQPAPLESTSEPQPVQTLKISEGAQSEHLQRKIDNLNLTEFELALGVDSVLERNKRKFDQLGAQNMLLNSLTIDDFLALQLVRNTTQKQKYPPWGEHHDIWSSDDPLMAFTELADFRARTQQSIEGRMRDEEVYEALFTDKEAQFYDKYQLIDIDVQYNKGKSKEIEKQIRIKIKNHPTDTDMVDEADQWLQERQLIDKKSNTKSQFFIKNEVKYQNPEDLVNFQMNVGAEEDTRQSVFMGQRDKNEFRQDIEDKFLLMNRLPYRFQLQKYPLTLKQNPRIAVKSAQNVEVDVRRQMISISDAKKKMKDLIHSRSTFRTLYNGYKQYDDISPALCFLTMLHLANEHGFGFEQIDDNNFYIR